MRKIATTLKGHAAILFGLLAIAWTLEIVDQVLLGRSLDFWGIRPRNPDALAGILFAPFLHGGFPHLAANSIPFAVLGWLVMLRRMVDFVLISVFGVLVGGFAVWLVAAPNTVHIGASGLIFAYLGYLLLRGYFERSVTSILIAVVATVLYGGALLGLLPGQRGISWEGHLAGFLSGGLGARLLVRPRPQVRSLA